MKLFNNYQKFQNIFAKDSKNFPKISLIFLYFLLEIFVKILKRYIDNFYKKFLKFLKLFLILKQYF